MASLLCRMTMSHILLIGLVTALSVGFSVAVKFAEITNRIQWVDCASNVPLPLQAIALPATLPPSLHCGRLNVPMDYAKPITVNNMITLGFSMYRPDNAEGLVNL
jgi:hypothetical protein